MIDFASFPAITCKKVNVDGALGGAKNIRSCLWRHLESGRFFSDSETLAVHLKIFQSNVIKLMQFNKAKLFKNIFLKWPKYENRA